MNTKLFYLAAFMLLASCSTSRQVAQKQPAEAAHKPVFLDNISTGSSGTAVRTVERPSNISSNANSSYDGSIENYPALQFKFAILTNSTVEEMNNPRLLSFMNTWYGVPYHYGGSSQEGIDCSAFVNMLVSNVYGISGMPRTSREQYNSCRHIARDSLQEGDLVFFHTMGKTKTVTHVGVYLRNNKFIHASTSGVMISDMGQGYYANRFVGAGRY